MENPDSLFESDYGPSTAVRDIVERWTYVARQEHPWCEMYLDDVSGGWRKIVDALLTDWRDTTGPDRRWRLRRAARAHGLFRRQQRCVPEALAEEVAVLEGAITEVLYRRGTPSVAIEQALRLLGPDFRSIGRALHAGYVDGPSSRRPRSRLDEHGDPRDE